MTVADVAKVSSISFLLCEIALMLVWVQAYRKFGYGCFQVLGVAAGLWAVYHSIMAATWFAPWSSDTSGRLYFWGSVLAFIGFVLAVLGSVGLARLLARLQLPPKPPPIDDGNSNWGGGNDN